MLLYIDYDGNNLTPPKYTAHIYEKDLIVYVAS